MPTPGQKIREDGTQLMRPHRVQPGKTKQLGAAGNRPHVAFGNQRHPLNGSPGLVRVDSRRHAAEYADDPTRVAACSPTACVRPPPSTERSRCVEPYLEIASHRHPVRRQRSDVKSRKNAGCRVGQCLVSPPQRCYHSELRASSSAKWPGHSCRDVSLFD